MIQVLLVDQQQLFCQAIESLLATEEDMEVVSKATTAQEAVKLTRLLEPDVVLLDLDFPEDLGIDIATYIKKNYPNTKVIFLSSEAPGDLIVAAMAVGVDGLLYKDLEADKLARSVRDAHEGEVIISGKVAKILAVKIASVQFTKNEIIKREAIRHDIDFTHREAEIAVLIMEGKRNQEISNTLNLNEGTIKNYISEMYSKMGIRKRKDVIVFLKSLFPRYYQL